MGYASWSVVFGEQPSAAKWNILGTNDSSFNDGTGIANLEIGSGHTSVKNDYKFSVYRNTAWTSTGSAYGLVSHDTKLFDTGTNVDVVTNKGRFTAPVAGFYFFAANAISNTAANASVRNALYKNGSIILVGENNENGDNTTALGGPVTGILQLAANDYAEHYHYGSASTGNTGSTDTYFHGFLLSQT